MNHQKDFSTTQGVFFGRQGTIRNLLHGIRAGESYLISGGPSTGKTALMHHVIDLLKQETSQGKHPSYLPIYFSCRNLEGGNIKDIADHLYYLLDTTYPKGLGLDRFILCLDDCEAFATPAGAEVFGHLLGPSGVSLLGVPWSVVWSGGEIWFQDYLRNRSGFPKPLRLVPLSIFTERETRDILKTFLGSSRSQECFQIIREQTGRHPYLLFTLLSYLKKDPQLTMDAVLKKCRPNWEAWARRCWEDLHQNSEKGEHYGEILVFLIDLQRPVNPSEVGRVLGIHDIKPYLDTLCRLGLSDRTLRDGEATIHAGCGFFNDWYKQIVNERKEC